jgi:hypothetical protein
MEDGKTVKKKGGPYPSEENVSFFATIRQRKMWKTDILFCGKPIFWQVATARAAASSRSVEPKTFY